ncbi:MAG: A/G-specific adenine glycosylase [Chloroflexi bacterium]|nr:A/G-specific adenine glycosylase [Chloroflexota bacterium]
MSSSRSNYENMRGDFILPLLTWYEQHAENLPWRQTRNPYHIWLSEIMLQQTQVATVIPYYERFLAKFPTIAALADAPQDDLLKQWEGLGYYSRARNLQAAAQQIIQSFDGELPQTATQLQELKGIGRYTAGAVASIAFDEHVPVLDGNVIRVFSRLFDNAEDVARPATIAKYWEMAEQLMGDVPTGQAGNYNQALMELGRTICKPRNPDCAHCPIAKFCLARANGTPNERPVKAAKAKTPHYDVTCGLIRNTKRELLIAKRRDKDLLGGLWEFPGGKVESGETLEACLARELHEEMGITVEVGEFLVKVQHAYTHFKITLFAFECVFAPTSAEPTCHECADFRWVSEERLSEFAFSKADRKIIEELNERPRRLL